MPTLMQGNKPFLSVCVRYYNVIILKFCTRHDNVVFIAVYLSELLLLIFCLVILAFGTSAFATFSLFSFYTKINIYLSKPF